MHNNLLDLPCSINVARVLANIGVIIVIRDTEILRFSDFSNIGIVRVNIVIG
jgi:hypothetical protein